MYIRGLFLSQLHDFPWSHLRGLLSPALSVFFTHHGETHTSNRESLGQRVQCVRSGSITSACPFKISSCDKVSSPLLPAGLFWETESARKQRGHRGWLGVQPGQKSTEKKLHWRSRHLELEKHLYMKSAFCVLNDPFMLHTELTSVRGLVLAQWENDDQREYLCCFSWDYYFSQELLNTLTNALRVLACEWRSQCSMWRQVCDLIWQTQSFNGHAQTC